MRVKIAPCSKDPVPLCNAHPQWPPLGKLTGQSRALASVALDGRRAEPQRATGSSTCDFTGEPSQHGLPQWEVTCEERSLHGGHRRRSGLEPSLNQHLQQHREHSTLIPAGGAFPVTPSSGLVTLNSGHPELCLPLGFYNSWPSQSKCGVRSGVIFAVSSADRSFRRRSNPIRYPGKNF